MPNPCNNATRHATVTAFVADLSPLSADSPGTSTATTCVDPSTIDVSVYVTRTSDSVINAPESLYLNVRRSREVTANDGTTLPRSR